jgi:hypothetical protein
MSLSNPCHIMVKTLLAELIINKEIHGGGGYR